MLRMRGKGGHGSCGQAVIKREAEEPKHLKIGFFHPERFPSGVRQTVLGYLQTADILMNAYKETTSVNESSLSESLQLSFPPPWPSPFKLIVFPLLPPPSLFAISVFSC